MSIISHTNSAVKSAVYLQSTPCAPSQPHPLAVNLAARMNAGAHERCPACLNWIAKKQVGAIAIYVPHDQRPQVAYALCRRCASAINGAAQQQSALTRKIESYLDGVVK